MTAIRFFNAHIIDPSQSIDGIGYLDVVNGVVDAIGHWHAAKNRKI